MGKFKMPNSQEFLKKKRIFGPIKDPVWVYIRREMKLNATRKPHQNKVLNWLLFLKDLRYHYFREAQMQYNRLCNECGPPWYLEYSMYQRQILQDMKDHIHEDILEDIPTRVKKDLRDLGITLRIPAETLMEAMGLCYDDPGLFLWRLYEKLYKKSPSELQSCYDLNSMLIMSALVFVDIDECVMELEKLTTRGTHPPSTVPKKKSCCLQPQVKYGEYLQQTRVPLYSNHPSKPPKPKKPLPIACKIKLRTAESYEKLVKKTEFLNKRKLRNVKSKLKERVCKYKFWEPPALFGSDKKTADLVLRMKMMKKSAKARHLKYKPQFDSVQCIITGVAYFKSRPIYIISTLFILPSIYTIINGGLTKFGNEFITQISGMWDSTDKSEQKCDVSCTCLKMWYPAVMKHVKTTKCNCGHAYDFESDAGRSTLLNRDTLFYPPTRNTPFLFDHAKIYQLNAYVEFINKTFTRALGSISTPVSSVDELELWGLSNKELLKMFLADLSDTALLIPHLPQANYLNNLLEWVRKRIRGPTTKANDRKLMLKSQRRWVELEHIGFQAKAYFIPFTLKQTQNFNWSHRNMIRKMATSLLNDFELRTRQEMLEHTRLFWATMMNDVYPSEPFVKAFFTYMPGRLYDTFVVDPYSVQNTPTGIAKTCALDKPL